MSSHTNGKQPATVLPNRGRRRGTNVDKHGAKGLPRGNLSAHAAKLVAAGYVEENKRIVDRKLLTEYCLTKTGRELLKRYRADSSRLTSGENGKRHARRNGRRQ